MDEITCLTGTDASRSGIRVERAAGVLVFDREIQQILLIRDRKGSWRFPSGRTLEGEQAVHAAWRELYEETGLESYTIMTLDVAIPLLSANGKRPADRRPKFTSLFPAVLAAHTLPPLRPRPGEVVEAGFQALDAAHRLMLSSSRSAAVLLAQKALEASLDTQSGGVSPNAQ